MYISIGSAKIERYYYMHTQHDNNNDNVRTYRWITSPDDVTNNIL